MVFLLQSFRRPKSFPWQRDLLEESLKAAGVTGFDSGARLNVSNLDAGVTNEDIRVHHYVLTNANFCRSLLVHSCEFYLRYFLTMYLQLRNFFLRLGS